MFFSVDGEPQVLANFRKHFNPLQCSVCLTVTFLDVGQPIICLPFSIISVVSRHTYTVVLYSYFGIARVRVTTFRHVGYKLATRQQNAISLKFPITAIFFEIATLWEFSSFGFGLIFL